MIERILKLKSTTQSICELENFVNYISNKYQINSTKYPDILISLTEAVNNAIIHGNKQDLSKTVKVSLLRTAKGLSFTVSDEGNGFDPDNIPDPTAPENLACCGGRGVFLIRELSDDVVYLNNGRTVKIHFNL